MRNIQKNLLKGTKMQENKNEKHQTIHSINVYKFFLFVQAYCRYNIE
jgi:hypothetical protein